MKNIKRILAILCIVILVGLYLITLIMAICDNSAAMSMFRGCVACTIFVPLVAYGYICLHKFAMKRSGRKDYYNDKTSKESEPKDHSEK